MQTKTATRAARGPAPALAPSSPPFNIGNLVRQQFIAYGILPLLLIVLIITFAVVEPRFISQTNIINVARQVSFLGIIAIAQMLYLITRNYDLSNGGTVALSSITCATVMVSAPQENPALAILLGCLAALLIGLIVGIINAVLIAVFKVSSFMVTLGTGFAATGVALLFAGGVPVTGLPVEFSRNFGTSLVMGIPFPTFMLILVFVGAYVLLNWTRLGRQAYAVGGNEKAAYQAGVNVNRTLIAVMVMGSFLAALVGVMITARVSTGEANIGVQYPMESIIAAVIGGIALAGGEGRVSGAFMGALFIVLLNNGMDLIRVQGYVQDILLGALLILALLVDRVRTKIRVTAPATNLPIQVPLTSDKGENK
ncbi:permease component of ribose/xylose/arabinose/galactoside ABC-type transporter [Arthrobacter crystallopoietes BAB-32]|uniref:Permease component of ribose/xylose/arabinose/galactoside ABC-type transporter n=1 Tax=Arthrobacter crystallopoietes BAB-32 TaxID=1246476 RepID=N1V1M0_9MICC|nr:ABC transporter permease [Arthrobacter crystallopoietes]EMY35230.1 permease component of ribose/xylose/arabinose/galactoside ABC-type transporter [Arthrobacter crystallopoietes BAB-32]